VGAAYTPENARTPEQKETLTISDSLIADLQEADEYVIGVPMHNFSIPSTLKLWIDQVARWKNVSYGSGGAKGLLSGRSNVDHGPAAEFTNTEPLGGDELRNPLSARSARIYGHNGCKLHCRRGTSKLMSGDVDPRAFLARRSRKCIYSRL